MKRALVLAVSASLFMGLFGGLASAQSTSGDEGPTTETVLRVGDDVEAHDIWKRCRRLFGEDELTVTAKERCRQLWERWCRAHPDSRRCHRRPVPPPPCRVTDRIVDHRCVPHPLPDGTYRLIPRPHDGLLGTAPAQEFIVEGGPVELDVAYDTGIR